MNEESKIRIGVTLENPTTQKFRAIKKQTGIKNNADTVRWLINRYYEKENLGKLRSEPELKHFNLKEDGVRIQDLSLASKNSPNGLIVDVAFKPEGVWCEYCQADDCRHIQFALTVPEVQDVVRKRRREGWNLPEV